MKNQKHPSGVSPVNQEESIELPDSHAAKTLPPKMYNYNLIQSPSIYIYENMFII